MTIDKYTKFLLTMIAVGIIGINFHLFKVSIVKDAFAATGNSSWFVHTHDGEVYILKDQGSKACQIGKMKWFDIDKYEWGRTGC